MCLKILVSGLYLFDPLGFILIALRVFESKDLVLSLKLDRVLKDVSAGFDLLKDWERSLEFDPGCFALFD